MPNKVQRKDLSDHGTASRVNTQHSCTAYVKILFLTQAIDIKALTSMLAKLLSGHTLQIVALWTSLPGQKNSYSYFSSSSVSSTSAVP